VLADQGNLPAAETLYRRVLAAQERLLARTRLHFAHGEQSRLVLFRMGNSVAA